MVNHFSIVATENSIYNSNLNFCIFYIPVVLKPMLITKSIILFILAGLCEIGGGYLVWLWLREGKSVFIGILGGVVLVLYGIIPTLQPAHFGRVYAAYGGVFVIMSILWGWKIDKTNPDRYDIIGGIVCLIGVFIIMYWPRSS